MILHKLIIRFLEHRDDLGFYQLQAEDTVRWLDKIGVKLDGGVRVLDLGCGHGMIGGELMKRGCQVTFADEANYLLPEYNNVDYREIDIERDDLGSLGTFDLIICSNVLEHIPRPARLLCSVDRILNPGGKFYLSWTNWLSPAGGHEFTPFHYLGPRWGHRVYDRVVRKPRRHTPYVNLFPVSIGGVLGILSKNPNLSVIHVLPRYYPELSFIMLIPVLREFLAFNCLILAERV